MPSPAVPALEIDLDLIRRFDGRGPRYTSYPTADRFVESYDAEAYQSWLARRNIGGIVRPLALYLHLPFCSTLCFYCGCNKIVTRDRSKGETYLKYLDEEMALQASLLGGDNKVRQMHWGGGTPTRLPGDIIVAIMRRIRARFDVAPDAEIAMEIDNLSNKVTR